MVVEVKHQGDACLLVQDHEISDGVGCGDVIILDCQAFLGAGIQPSEILGKPADGGCFVTCSIHFNAMYHSSFDANHKYEHYIPFKPLAQHLIA